MPGLSQEGAVHPYHGGHDALSELISDMGNALRAKTLKLIADRDTTFQVAFTKDPARFLKEGEE